MFLWVQQIVTQGRVRLGKKGTDEMLADILTKPVNEKIMERMLRGMAFFFEEGKRRLAKSTA